MALPTEVIGPVKLALVVTVAALPEMLIAYVPDVIAAEKFPAVKLAAVNPVMVFDPAAIVLLVKVSVLDGVIYPELFVHWEILAEEKLEVVNPEIAVSVTPETLP